MNKTRKMFKINYQKKNVKEGSSIRSLQTKSIYYQYRQIDVMPYKSEKLILSFFKLKSQM